MTEIRYIIQQVLTTPTAYVFDVLDRETGERVATAYGDRWSVAKHRALTIARIAHETTFGD